jgi:hypothetical protein
MPMTTVRRRGGASGSALGSASANTVITTGCRIVDYLFSFSDEVAGMHQAGSLVERTIFFW